MGNLAEEREFPEQTGTAGGSLYRGPPPSTQVAERGAGPEQCPSQAHGVSVLQATVTA